MNAAPYDFTFGSHRLITGQPEDKVYPIITSDGNWDNRIFMRAENMILHGGMLQGVCALNAVMLTFGLDMEKVSAIYSLKAYLNTVRQQNGYSKGEYKKIIGGQEDNEFLKPHYDNIIKNETMTLDDMLAGVRNVFK